MLEHSRLPIEAENARPCSFVETIGSAEICEKDVFKLVELGQQEGLRCEERGLDLKNTNKAQPCHTVVC